MLIVPILSKIITSFTWPLGEVKRIQEYSFGAGTFRLLCKTFRPLVCHVVCHLTKGPFKYYVIKEVGGVRKWQFLMIYSTVNHQRGGLVGLKKSKT